MVDRTCVDSMNHLAGASMAFNIDPNQFIMNFVHDAMQIYRFNGCYFLTNIILHEKYPYAFETQRSKLAFQRSSLFLNEVAHFRATPVLTIERCSTSSNRYLYLLERKSGNSTV